MITFLLTLLPTLPPRHVPLRPHREAHHVIYVDASFHNSVPTVAATFIPATAKNLTAAVYTAAVVPAELARLLSPDSTVLINQMELLATLVAVRTFLPLMLGTPSILFTDNTVSLSTLIHGYSSKPTLAAIANDYYTLVAQHQLDIWHEWVPSAANLADAPSRLDFTTLQCLGASRLDANLPKSIAMLS